MKYKVGDKVKLKSKEGLDELERQVEDLYIHPDAYKNAGSEQTILECNDGFYRYDASSMFWHESLFEGLVEDTDERLLKRAADAFKKIDEMMEARYQKNKTYCGGEQWSTEFECPNGYIFKDENGNVINAMKIVLEKKKKEYPKTYKECYRIMNIDTGFLVTSYDLDFWKGDLLTSLQKLLVCRDAYWKLYGEEMGLGKPWEPDWKSGDEKKWVISRYRGELDFGFNIEPFRIFAFPTKEMRDAFYENFKSEIESCKELL